MKRDVEILMRNGRFLVACSREALPFSLSQVARESGYRVDALCSRIGVSERHLRRLFLDDLGIGPKEWMRQERMVASRFLLREGSSIKEIAGDLGFTNYKVFSREFLAYHGVSPSDFQRKEFGHRLPVAS